MRIRELKKDSAEEAELLEAAAAAYGEWVWSAARLMDRLLLMRSAWAPGLRALGGVARSGATVLSASGAGLRLEDALAACLGEAVERLAQVERPVDIAVSAPVNEVRPPDQIFELIARIPAAASAAPIDWIKAKSCVTGAETLLPADWCLRRAGPIPLAVPGAALSTGCAAAATVGEAAARGLLELIERDAASLWWQGGQPAAPLMRDSSQAAAAGRMIGELRQAQRDRDTFVLDITSDIGVPVMAAFSHDHAGRGIAVGLAARPSPGRAASSAVIELAQMELGLQLAYGRNEELGEAALTPEDRRHLARAEVPVADVTSLVPAAEPRPHAAPNRMTVGELGDVLAGRNIDAWYVDLTRSEGLPAVAKVIAPALQPMPGDVVTARLAAVARGQRPPAVTLM